jgi:hypothetical protein
VRGAVASTPQDALHAVAQAGSVGITGTHQRTSIRSLMRSILVVRNGRCVVGRIVAAGPVVVKRRFSGPAERRPSGRTRGCRCRHRRVPSSCAAESASSSLAASTVATTSSWTWMARRG